MNKSEGKYNKEERGGTWISSFFSKKQNEEKVEEPFFASATEQQSTQKESEPVSNNHDNIVEEVKEQFVEEEYANEDELTGEEEYDYEEEDYDYIEVDDYDADEVEEVQDDANDCPPTPAYGNGETSIYQPTTMTGMILGLLSFVLLPYIIIAAFFLFDTDSTGNDIGNIEAEVEELFGDLDNEEMAPQYLQRSGYNEVEVGDTIFATYHCNLNALGDIKNFKGLRLSSMDGWELTQEPEVRTVVMPVIKNNKHIRETTLVSDLNIKAVSEDRLQFPQLCVILKDDTLIISPSRCIFPNNRISVDTFDLVLVRPKGYFNAKYNWLRKKNLKNNVLKCKQKYKGRYNIKNKTLTLTEFIDNEFALAGYGAKRIVADCKVWCIPSNAFRGFETIESVDVDCEIVKANSFKECSSLKNVIINKHLTMIEDSAFAKCESLERILLSNTVTQIGKGVFANSHNIKEIGIPYMARSYIFKQLEHCKELRTFYFLSPTYYAMPTGLKALDNDLSKCTLYVTDKKIEEFKSDSDWSKFGSILPLSQSKWYDAEGWGK